MRRQRIALVLALLLSDALAWSDTSLRKGVLVHRGGTCGEARPLVVQFSGGGHTLRLDLPVGAETPLALPRGMHRVVVSEGEGRTLEESLVWVREDGFRLEVGCPWGAPVEVEAKDPAGVQVVLANTTPSCGRPEEAEYRVQGRVVGMLKPGEVRRVRLPVSRPVVVDVAVGGRRQWTFSVARPGNGETWAYGCTQPDLAQATVGIPVAFENTTDQCPDPGKVTHLTLWVDGEPVVGIPPGGRTAVRVAPGLHDFEVRPGLSLERVVRGQRDVQGPFRIHFGCGR